MTGEYFQVRPSRGLLPLRDSEIEKLCTVPLRRCNVIYIHLCIYSNVFMYTFTLADSCSFYIIHGLLLSLLFECFMKLFLMTILNNFFEENPVCLDVNLIFQLLFCFIFHVQMFCPVALHKTKCT